MTIHGHGHGHCQDEGSDHDHDHDHPTSTGPGDNLYSHIDIQNVTILNISEETSDNVILKPWHERLDETVWIESEADDQLCVYNTSFRSDQLLGGNVLSSYSRSYSSRIIRIPFTGSIRLRSVLLKAGPGDQTPLKFCLFANEDNVDFSDIAEKTPSQEFAVPQGRDVGEYAVKASKFSNISSLTIFFPESQGNDTIRLYYIGLRGAWTERRREPIIAVYETQANLADHEKIQGTDGGLSASRLGS